jgi:hypothetical protein
MSDTPRTDAQYKEYARRDNDVKCVDIEFARTLERDLHAMRVWGSRRDEEMQHQAKLAMEARGERDQLKSDNENLRKLVGWTDGKLDVEELLNERDQLRAEVELFKSQLAKSNRDCLDARAEARDSTATDNSIKLLELLKTTSQSCDQWRAVAEQLAFAGATIYGHQQAISSEETRWGLAVYEQWREVFAAYEKLNEKG